MTENRKNMKPPRSPEEIEREAYDEIPEITEQDFARARPMREMFPEIVQAFEKMRGQRGPQKTPVKERVGLRLDSDIVEYFRNTGPGWQSRINDILAAHAKQGEFKNLVEPMKERNRSGVLPSRNKISRSKKRTA